MAPAMTKGKSLFSDSNKQTSDSVVMIENVPSGSKEDPNLAKPMKATQKNLPKCLWLPQIKIRNEIL